MRNPRSLCFFQADKLCERKRGKIAVSNMRGVFFFFNLLFATSPVTSCKGSLSILSLPFHIFIRFISPDAAISKLSSRFRLHFSLRDG